MKVSRKATDGAQVILYLTDLQNNEAKGDKGGTLLPVIRNLFYSAELEHLAVCFGFLGQGEGVGTGGRGKAVEHHLLSIGKEARNGHILPR